MADKAHTKTDQKLEEMENQQEVNSDADAE